MFDLNAIKLFIRKRRNMILRYKDKQTQLKHLNYEHKNIKKKENGVLVIFA